MSKKHNKYSGKLSFIVLLLGLFCLLLFKIQGSELDSDGILHEPFALLVLGYVLVFASTPSLFVISINGLRRYLKVK